MLLHCAKHGRVASLSSSKISSLGFNFGNGLKIRTIFHNAPTDLEALYGVSTGRWLYNDKFQRAVRYTPFSVEGLKEVACKAVDAGRCVHLSKIGYEGMNNKVFLMRFNNGKEAVARIPTSLAGNSCLATASEAATLQYLRDECKLPVPRVLARSSESQPNPVGRDFMIMEYVPGVPLLWRWQAISHQQAVDPLATVMRMEAILTKHTFSQIGALYFKEDVSPELQSKPLYLDSDSRKTSEAAYKYRIGPMAGESWWRGKRLQMVADRGPFPDMISYITAAVKLQKTFLDALDDNDIDQGFQHSTKSDIPELHKLLEHILLIAPHIVPKNPSHRSPILAHPELVLPNVMVDATGNATVKAFLDWQGTVVAPVVMQVAPASILRYTGDKIECSSTGKPILPADIDRLPPHQRENLRIHYKLAMRQYIYISTITQVDPCRKELWSTAESYVAVFPYLVTNILRCWADGPFRLRSVLIQLWRDWENICANGTTCPIHFSKEELEVHRLEEEQGEVLYEQTESLKWDTSCHGDGWVDNADFDKSREIMEKSRKRWEREQGFVGPFPFREGAWAAHLA